METGEFSSRSIKCPLFRPLIYKRNSYMKKSLLAYLSLFLLAAVAVISQSCSFIKDDLEDCPAGLYVRFVYDYNTARADLFKDHVGFVHLFVYNEQGKLVADRTVANTDEDAPLQNYGYAIHFDDGQLPPGRYRLQAIAFQKHYDDALATPGAKYRHNSPDLSHELLVELDHDIQKLEGSDKYPVSNVAPLDTLWHTLKVSANPPTDGVVTPPLQKTSKPYSIYPLEDQYVEVANGLATYATVSLIRDTKHINILLRQIDDPDNISHADFDVAIADRSKSLAHDNAPASDLMLHYTPYQKWTTHFDGITSVVEYDDTDSRATALQRTAHYNLMCNRIIHSDNANEAACLTIVNKKTGAKVVEINLASMLAEARIAYDAYHYSEQEYLDREYDYHLHFFLKGDTWEYCDISINTLSWSKRIQKIEL